MADRTIAELGFILLSATLLPACVGETGADDVANESDNSDSDGSDAGAEPLCGDGQPAAGERCWHEVETLPTGDGVEVIKIVDVDGDGQSELVFGLANGANYFAAHGPAGLGAVLQGALDRQGRAVCDDPRGLATGSVFAVEGSSSDATLARFEHDPNDAAQLRLDSRTDLPSYGLGCVVANLDGDGSPEVVVTHFVGDSATAVDTSDSGLTVMQTISVGVHPRGVRAGDIDGDGRDEVVLVLENYIGSFGAPDSYTDPGQVVVLDTTAEGKLLQLATHEVMYQPQDLDLGDFDGDGRLDLAVAGLNRSVEGGVATLPEPGEERVSVLWGGPSGFSERLDLVGGNSARNIRASDFDRDGTADFATVTYDSLADETKLQIWYAGGATRSFERVEITVGKGLKLDVGDLDGDTVVDFVAAGVLVSDLDFIYSNP